jgi:hypothetical protein
MPMGRAFVASGVTNWHVFSAAPRGKRDEQRPWETTQRRFGDGTLRAPVAESSGGDSGALRSTDVRGAREPVSRFVTYEILASDNCEPSVSDSGVLRSLLVRLVN